MPDQLLQALVWTDYRLAVLFTVLIPLILIVWAFVKKADAIVRLLIIYWRVSSLLAITVYIMIASWPIGFISGWFARILIPICLWFWVDVNEDIEDQPTNPLKLTLTAWRWAITIYCGIGVLWSIPYLGCAFTPEAAETFSCRVWLEPPWLFKQYFHPESSPQFLGLIGIVGLLFYVLYLSYFVLIRLGKQGRIAMEQ